eukprot:CAMPEP_0170860604 /NCGR_PEP_ID=MMETSP0734-20130129/17610_1 /TAXON_ID=186038 /ORGANISM="Fragilariopsis kerguelensis, Strain L26-C5" /LENGTH=286 /DNA_ID=CAMNT_0011234311 /DNA_START=207 /DNA_END=1067 /DNA_ORIENTATION=-
MNFTKTTILALTFFFTEGKEASLRGLVSDECDPCQLHPLGLSESCSDIVKDIIAERSSCSTTWDSECVARCQDHYHVVGDYVAEMPKGEFDPIREGQMLGPGDDLRVEENVWNDYNIHTTGGCIRRNDQMGKFEYHSITECAETCDKFVKCVSFEFAKEKSASGKYRCHMSRSCTFLSQTVNKSEDGNYWFQKKLDGYQRFDDGGCVKMNDKTFETFSLHQCAEECNNYDGCISFEYPKNPTEKGSQRCAVSKECTTDHNVNDFDDKNYLFVKYVQPRVDTWSGPP